MSMQTPPILVVQYFNTLIYIYRTGDFDLKLAEKLVPKKYENTVGPAYSVPSLEEDGAFLRPCKTFRLNYDNTVIF